MDRIALTFWITSIFAVHINPASGNGCRFNGDMAVCKHAGLSYIPDIPAYIKTLVFVGNELKSVTKESFQKIEMPSNMTKINLASNRIYNVSEDAFDVFTNLSSLELTGNKINVNDMKNLLVKLSQGHHLDELYLNHMGSEVINRETFSLLNETPGLNLYLESNHIKVFPVDTLKRLNNILEIILDNNDIKDVNLPYMESLLALRLSHNRLNAIPDFCSDNNTSLTKNLKALFLNYNYIYALSNATFQCLPNLNKLQLGNNVISTYPTMLFANNPNIIYFSAGANSAHSVKIHQFAFSSKTLQFLKIGFNGNALDVFISLSDTFQGLPKLQKLELSYINMFYLTNENYSELFSPITNVTTIQCFGCQMQGDLNYILGNKPNLVKINFKKNYFQDISPRIFSEDSNISQLMLGMNKFGHISSEALPVRFLEKLTALDLSKNPFICDCKLLWLINWLKAANKSKLAFYPKGYTCASPAKWANKQLQEVHFSFLECHPFSTIEWVGMIGGPLVIIIIIITVILYRNRWNIKHYIYMMRKRREYTPLEGDEYRYDAFVAYSSTEIRWIREFLVPMVEDEFNLKLCVHDRDFQAGTFINDNIVERMRESKRIILVLSNSFANSDWCMFELKVAHSMHIEDNIDVIAIMFEELLGRNMNNSLKVLLESTTYIEWTEDNVGHELFVTRLKDSLGVAVNG